MSTGVPVHHNTCSVYLFLFGITSTFYLSTHLQGYVHTDLPDFLCCLFIFMLLFCLNTTIYLSPQLLVYMPIHLPVHYPTCSFWLFHSDKQFVLTFLLPAVLNIRRFTFSSINRFNLCFSLGFTCTLICQLICWSAYRQTHPKMNVPANFDATWYVNLPVHLQTCLYTHRSCSSWSFLSG